MKDKILKMLRLQRAISRDEVLCAASAAFGGVRVEAATDSWTLRIETTPRREIVVTDEWRARYVDSGRYSRTDIQKRFFETRHKRHWADVNGVLRFLLTLENQSVRVARHSGSRRAEPWTQ